MWGVRCVGHVGEHVQSETVRSGAPVVDASRDDRGDPRAEALRQAVARLRAELDAHPADLRDRREAERALDELDAAARTGRLDMDNLLLALLILTAALGSVSALGAALGEVRGAIDLFGAARS